MRLSTAYHDLYQRWHPGHTLVALDTLPEAARVRVIAWLMLGRPAGMTLELPRGDVEIVSLGQTTLAEAGRPIPSSMLELFCGFGGGQLLEVARVESESPEPPKPLVLTG